MTEKARAGRLRHGRPIQARNGSLVLLAASSGIEKGGPRGPPFLEAAPADQRRLELPNSWSIRMNRLMKFRYRLSAS